MNSNNHIKNHIVWSHSDNETIIFERIFKRNLWHSEESISGKGSELAATENILYHLPQLLTKYHISTLIDAPCGDYNWMQYLNFNFDKYLGIDIVEDIILHNQIYEDNIKKFVIGNILDYKFPAFDLILCRDCFIHLTYKQIFDAIKNFKSSNIKYLLTTTYNIPENVDVLTGQFRKINLFLPPFDFPSSSEMIDDDKFDNKFLALWRLCDL